MKRQIPDLYIEQLLLDELPEEKIDIVLASGGVKDRIDDLKKSNEEILHLYSPEEMGAAIEERIKTSHTEVGEVQQGFRRMNRWMPLLAAAAVATLILYLVPVRFQGTGADTGPAAELTRIKGATPSLNIYRQVSGGSEKLSDGSTAFTNDLIQISYSPAGKRYGAIISIDGRGHVTLHYPERISESRELQSGGEILLPFAYELDDAPGFERFYFISSDTDFSLSSVILSAESVAASHEGKSLDSLPLPMSFSQDSMVLLKGVIR